MVAHYRAGSSFASFMFSEHPGALYIFEPGSVYHVAWTGTGQSLAKDEMRTQNFLQRVCGIPDLSDLPNLLNLKLSQAAV